MRSFRFVAIAIVLILVVPTNVLAASYDNTVSICAEADPQGRSFMDLEVKYSSPDTVAPGSILAVDVLVAYLNDSNAKFAWVEVSHVTVSLLRQISSGGEVESVASDRDPSTQRLIPGQQYSHRFNVKAPQATGQYLLNLHWRTDNPATYAYGWGIWTYYNDWDTYHTTYDSQPVAPTVTVQLTATVANSPSFQVSNSLITAIAIVIAGAIIGMAFIAFAIRRPKATAKS